MDNPGVQTEGFSGVDLRLGDPAEGANNHVQRLAIVGIVGDQFLSNRRVARRFPLVTPNDGLKAGRSGRALQEVFVELSVCGLASMYQASDWSFCSGPSWISARVRSH